VDTAVLDAAQPHAEQQLANKVVHVGQGSQHVENPDD
jgi:hypothetical protein